MTGVSLGEVATSSPLTWPPSLTASSPMTGPCPPRPPALVLAGCPPEQALSMLLRVHGRHLSTRPWEQVTLQLPALSVHRAVLPAGCVAGTALSQRPDAPEPPAAGKPVTPGRTACEDPERGASRGCGGSLSDDSCCREFPNDSECFHFWACAQFPTEQPSEALIRLEHKGPFSRRFPSRWRPKARAAARPPPPALCPNRAGGLCAGSSSQRPAGAGRSGSPPVLRGSHSPAASGTLTLLRPGRLGLAQVFWLQTHVAFGRTH